MSATRRIVIGASAGGIEAVRTLVAGLPDTFSAPICIVVHTAPGSPGIMAEILGRDTRLPVSFARDGCRLQAGHISLAPPDEHLLLEPGRVRVTKGPSEHRFRPAIDPLFRSAAQVFGPAAIGVVLTGNLDDGTAGLWMIKKLGGIAVVQDPQEAMPRRPAPVGRRRPYEVPLPHRSRLLGRQFAGGHERGDRAGHRHGGSLDRRRALLMEQMASRLELRDEHEGAARLRESSNRARHKVNAMNELMREPDPVPTVED
jgi:hypothetical protein